MRLLVCGNGSDRVVKEKQLTFICTETATSAMVLQLTLGRLLLGASCTHTHKFVVGEVAHMTATILTAELKVVTRRLLFAVGHQICRESMLLCWVFVSTTIMVMTVRKEAYLLIVELRIEVAP